MLTGAAHVAIVQSHTLPRMETVLVEVRVGELGALQRSLGHPLMRYLLATTAETERKTR